MLGYLDDLLILPLGIALAVRLVPAPLLAEFRETAALRAERPRSYVAAALIIIIWMAALVGMAAWLQVR